MVSSRWAQPLSSLHAASPPRAGLDPDRDVRIVVVGEGAQTAALVRKGEVDAVSQFDTGQAMLENAGIALRFLDSPETDGFPSGGLMALDETLRTQRKQAVALARGYAGHHFPHRQSRGCHSHPVGRLSAS